MFGEWLIKGRQIKACCEKLADPRSCSMYIRAHNPINILKQNLMLVLLSRDHLVFDQKFGDKILALICSLPAWERKHYLHLHHLGDALMTGSSDHLLKGYKSKTVLF